MGRTSRIAVSPSRPSLRRLLTFALAVTSLTHPWSDCEDAIADASEHREKAQIAHAPPSRVASAANHSLSFEENLGQADSSVRFVARTGGWTLLLTDADAVFCVPVKPTRTARGPNPTALGLIRMTVEGAAEHAPVGSGLASGRVNWFIGNDPKRWRTDIRLFDEVQYPRIRDSIDMVWSTADRRPGYRFECRPASRPESLALRFSGAESLTLDSSGDLLLHVNGGTLRHSRPVAYQDGPTGRREVSAAFALLGRDRVGFRFGAYDPAVPLTIDPYVEYSSYFGSASTTQTQTRLGVDGSGAVYLCGETTGAGSIDVQNAYQQFPAGFSDFYVSKFSADGSTLVYSTYIGGSAEEFLRGFAVDAGGAAVLTGFGFSPNYPLQDPFEPDPDNSGLVITKLSAAGNSLSFSTYFDTNADPTDITCDSAGDIYVVFSGAQADFPVVNAIRATPVGNDAGLAKIESDGSGIVYSTFIGGGSATEWPESVAVDSQGAVLVVGRTNSTDLPLVAPLQSSPGGGGDALLAKVNPAGTAFEFVTYLGGSGYEEIRSISFDGDDDIYVVGFTASTDLPLQSAFQTSHGGGTYDLFASKLSSDGSTLVYSSYLGGPGSEYPYRIAVAPDGSAWVGGSTTSSGYPTVDPLQGSFAGGVADGVLTRISPSGSSLAYSSYLGGDDADYVRGVALNGSDVVVAGETKSANFPTVTPYLGTNTKGTLSAFFARFIPRPLPPTAFEAALTDLTVALIEWQDESSEETGFELERKDDGGAYELLAALPADTTSFEDSDLERGHTYTYRVRAVNVDGGSAFTNEAAVLSPPIPVLPPNAPSALVTEVQPDGSIRLTWQDNSVDEEQFQINRNVSGGAFSIRASLISGTTSFLDTVVVADRTYSYSVRAVNQIGVSGFTPVSAVTTPPSVDLTLVKGSLRDSAIFGRDSLIFTVVLSPNGLSPDGTFDPVADGLTLRLGTEGQAPLFMLAPADPLWVPKRRGRFAWKSPRESITKARLLWDPATTTLKVTLKKLTFATPPATPILLWIGGANDAGHVDGPWTLRRPGVLKFP